MRLYTLQLGTTDPNKWRKYWAERPEDAIHSALLDTKERATCAYVDLREDLRHFNNGSPVVVQKYSISWGDKRDGAEDDKAAGQSHQG